MSFSLGGAKATAAVGEMAEVNLLGLVLMSVAVVMDGMEMALRVELFSPKYGASKSEVLQYQSFCAAILLLVC